MTTRPRSICAEGGCLSLATKGGRCDDHARPSAHDRGYDATYRTVRRYVLDRDDWRCVRCGSRVQVDVHHVYRSDREARVHLPHRMVALCRTHHRQAEREGVPGWGGIHSDSPPAQNLRGCASIRNSRQKMYSRGINDPG